MFVIGEPRSQPLRASLLGVARSFNTAGPCQASRHYMLPPLRRLPQIRGIIDRQHYVVIHAPRQAGKTTALMALAASLSAEGRYAAVLVSAEQGAPFSWDSNPGAAELAVLDEWAAAAGDLPKELRPPPWPDAPAGSRVRAALAAWAECCPRPVVLFIDEIDALRGNVLLSLLRQLRAGHRRRPEHFPSTVALVGMRDVRDYKVDAPEHERLGSASPFNIKVESLTLANFSRDEVEELFAQHTEDSGQRFEGEAIDRAHALSGGQPWLVNALARHAVDVLKTDRSSAITTTDIEAAAGRLIERQDTHLDSLSERLREPRIHAIVGPMLAGGTLGDIPRDDQRLAVDLGLLRWSEDGGLEVANPIYREVIVRDLADGPRASLPKIEPTWLNAQGQLEPDTLRDAFLEFWCQHGEAMLGSAPYREVAAQLVLMAFLHRVVNGGGRIEREYAIGRGRMDLWLRLGDVTVAMELKVWRDGQADPLEAGLRQLDGYLDGLGLGTGWLVIFDQRTEAGRAGRVGHGTATSPAGRLVTVLRP